MFPALIDTNLAMEEIKVGRVGGFLHLLEISVPLKLEPENEKEKRERNIKGGFD